MHSDKMHSARGKAARERRSPKETALTSTTQPAQVERPQWAPELVETPEDRGQKDRTLPYKKIQRASCSPSHLKAASC